MDTADNARLSAAMLKAEDIERIVLVTHAFHMPRARQLFAAEGLSVAAAPTDFRGRNRQPLTVFDFRRSRAQSRTVITPCMNTSGSLGHRCPAPELIYGATMPKQALIVIDLQKDYFPDGKFPLWNTEETLTNSEAAIALAKASGGAGDPRPACRRREQGHCPLLQCRQRGRRATPAPARRRAGCAGRRQTLCRQLSPDDTGRGTVPTRRGNPALRHDDAELV